MTNEIKEILNKWKCYIGLTKKFTTNEYEMLRVEDIDKILDYITNLQEIEKEHQRINGELREESKRLNNIINELEERLISVCENCYEDKYTAKMKNWIKRIKGE